MNPWIWIALGGLFEASWAVTLNMSDCFTDPLWTMATIIINFVSISFLYKGLREGTPVGGSYAVWTGCGLMCSVFFGIVLFGDMIPPLSWVFLALLIIGVLMMQGSEGSEPQEEK